MYFRISPLKFMALILEESFKEFLSGLMRTSMTQWFPGLTNLNPFFR